MGTIRVEAHGNYCAAVEWDDNIGGHTIGGMCSDGHGLYVPASAIRYAGESAGESTRAPQETRCRLCGKVLNKKSVLGTRLFKNGGFCDDCIESEIAVVHSYHTAKNYKYNVCPDDITFGFEAEIDGSQDFGWDNAERDELVADAVEYARNHNYPLICTYENDGSLTNGGVECVSAPLTIKDLKSDAVKNQIDFLFRRAEEIGFDFRDGNHAGLHIHIGRKSLCGDERAVSDAVGLLMGWAVSRLWSKGFKKLSRRLDCGYCKDYAEIGHGNGLRDTFAVSDRYYAVNIQNAKTIELRVFNCACTYEDIVLAVDVCYMLAKWATKKIQAFLKRDSYSAKSKDFTDALAYADRITWDALVKYSKFPEYTLPAMRRAGINV